MKTFVTEYHQDGKLYGDFVEAESWDEALQKCFSRRQDEIVVGTLVTCIELSSRPTYLQNGRNEYTTKGKHNE